MTTTNTDYAGWAIVEIMGHQKYSGLVSTQAIGGASMVRIDIPAIEGHEGFTKLFGTASIYCITPVSEDLARAMATTLRQSPINIYELPKEYRQALLAVQQAKLGGPNNNDFEFDDEERPY